MKHVVSVSLGSSRRDHAVDVELLGEVFRVERRGTDGDVQAAIRLIQELDGKVDAFGMGGIDLYVVSAGRRYVLRDAVPIARAARLTPIVDGSGLKDTLERRVVRHLAASGRVEMRGKTALLVSAVDRFGMAEALDEAGCRLILGDLAFSVGVPIVFHSLRSLSVMAFFLAPIICRLPFSMLYPVGAEQERIHPRPVTTRYYQAAEIIAGDFHFIRRYMPDRLDGKVVLTNTVTREDVVLLRERGVRTLVTTTPELEGRSFGTNVMEALLVAAAGKRAEELTIRDYEALLDAIGFQPRVEELSPQGAVQ